MYIPYTMQAIIRRDRKTGFRTVSEGSLREGGRWERNQTPSAEVTRVWGLRQRIAQAVQPAD